ncbi:MAG: hypothetical protein AB8G11_07585 [Saprospiraceae bacterium]
MQENYSTIKRNRKLQRFFRFVVLYFLLWFVFRYAVEAFRGNYISAALGDIVWTGLIFSVVLGMYSLYKKQVLYIHKNDKSDAIEWLNANNFEMTKQINNKTLLYIQPKNSRLERHIEVIVRDFDKYIELECDIKLKDILSKKLPII